MATSTSSHRAELKSAGGSDASRGGTVCPHDETLARAEEHHSPADERVQAVIVLPDIVELAWEPYYLEPPD